MRRTLTLSAVVLAAVAWLSVASFGQIVVSPSPAPQFGVWDDLVTVAGAVNPLGADGQASVNNDAATFIGCLEFDATGETAVAQFQLSHSTMDNTDLIPHVHWAVSGADVTGTAAFQAKFRHCPLGATCGGWTEWATGTLDVEPADAEGGAGITDWTLADSTYNFGISDVILMQFKLSATSVTDVMVCTVDIHYRKAGIGSINETSR